MTTGITTAADSTRLDLADLLNATPLFAAESSDLIWGTETGHEATLTFTDARWRIRELAEPIVWARCVQRTSDHGRTLYMLAIYGAARTNYGRIGVALFNADRLVSVDEVAALVWAWLHGEVE